MGARQSKRSVDITTTPKKEGLPVEGVVGDAAAPGDGKLEKIEETDAKPTTNGVAPHTDAATPEEKDQDKDEATEKENGKEDETKSEEAKVESPTTENPAEGNNEVTTPTEETPASPTTATSPNSKETKKKDKVKKKWSLRSISFGKKDKNKPAREDTPKNGDVTKEEPLAEGGEETETAEAAVPTSPADEKTPLSSPTDKEQPSAAAVPIEASPEVAATTEETKTPTSPSSAVASSPIDDKKDETSTPVTNPVPVEPIKSEDNEMKSVDNASADNKVEVSQVRTVIAVPIVEITQSKQNANIATTTTTTTTATTATHATTAPSIIERKTSEDFPSQFPSSPPPTPIDPSPLQKAQQVAASATALAEALKLPAEEAANLMAGQNFVGEVTSLSKNSHFQNETTTMDDTVTINTTINHEITVNTDKSLSHEQTGNAFPLPVVINAVSIEDPPSAKPMIEDTEASIPGIEDSQKSDVTAKIEPEYELVIQSEEGPVPISGDAASNNEEDPKVIEVLEVNENQESLELAEPVTQDKISENSDSAEVINEPIVEGTNFQESTEKDVPPPLPESPIPVPKVTSQLLNFMTTQIEDSPVIAEIIVNAKNLALTPEDSIGRGIDRSETSEDIEEIEETDETNSQIDEQRNESAPRSPLPQADETTDSRVSIIAQAIDEVEDLPLPQEIPSKEVESCLLSFDDDIPSTESPKILDQEFIPIATIPETDATTILLTPPKSPCNITINNDDISHDLVNLKSSSELTIDDDLSNREFKMESVSQSLNSYNDSEHELKERLAESMMEESVDCQITNYQDHENDQSKIEPEAPVENNVVSNDISTTEVNDEAPKSPPPAVPAEAPAPILGPAITEDVASVTKAIEEIDINEKAVAAAVNENIDAINTNEIIADMNHQNNMNE